jgi:hypothetical protein
VSATKKGKTSAKAKALPKVDAKVVKVKGAAGKPKAVPNRKTTAKPAKAATAKVKPGKAPLAKAKAGKAPLAKAKAAAKLSAKHSAKSSTNASAKASKSLAKASASSLADTPAKNPVKASAPKPKAQAAPEKTVPPTKPAVKNTIPQLPKAPEVTAKKTPAEKPADKIEELAKPAPKAVKTTVDDMPLDIEEKDQLLEEEKKDLAKALRDDEDEPLETAFIPTDTSERYILVVDEEGQRRNETLTIVQQILPNAVVEVADDPEEALEIMQDVEFDTYVVNFLMPGYSASPFVKAVANHPDHPLLIGFAADKISDALDQKKGLKIIPLKRLFDLDVAGDGKDASKAAPADKED